MVGRADLKEICSFIEENYPQVSFGVLWDFSKGNLSLLSNKDFQTIMTLVDKVTAYVNTDLQQFGLLRMYTTLAEINRVAPMMKEFKALEDAEKWLNELHNGYALKKARNNDKIITSPHNSYGRL